ncbi:cytotoxin 10-like [Conger conger]|uniref:cytotoxin 10-like n=1 Tax=Conger conger TaxID=82655 RepID=UPI002A59A49D|nr:cytotoxin 10-like [Conger conger]
MKVLVFSLTLLLILTCGEALKCNHCVPPKGSTRCTTTVEECGYGKDACVSASFTIAPYSSFRRCISKYDCRLLQGSPYINAYCCDTDRCN